MKTNTVVRVLIVVLATLALTALVAAAQDNPAAPGQPVAPQKAQAAFSERSESAAPSAAYSESEPNNSFTSADVIDPYVIVSGVISAPSDLDYFYIDLEDESLYSFVIDIDAETAGSWLDPFVCIYRHDKVLYACNDDSDGLDSMLYVAVPQEEDDYYITVQDFGYPDFGGGNQYTYTIAVYGPTFISSSVNGSVGWVSFQAADILAYVRWLDDGTPDGTDKYVLFFNASDFNITRNLSSFSISPSYAALSFSGNITVKDSNNNNLVVTPYDIVKFNPDQWGPKTKGDFSPNLILDGSAVGLTTAGEKIDAIGIVESNRASISTTGAAAVPAAAGGTLKGRDEDLLTVNLSTGKWRMEYDYSFDGSSVPGLATEDVIAADFGSVNAVYWLDLVIAGSGVIDGHRVNQKDVFTVEYDYNNLVYKDIRFPFNIDAIGGNP